MSIQEQIKKLAKETGTSEGDVEFFAKLMLNQMKSDGLTVANLDNECVKAYSISAAKTSSSLSTECLTNVNARQAMLYTVHSLLTK